MAVHESNLNLKFIIVSYILLAVGHVVISLLFYEFLQSLVETCKCVVFQLRHFQITQKN